MPGGRVPARLLVIRNAQAGDHTGLGTGTPVEELQSALARHGLEAEIFDSPSEDATAERVDAAVQAGDEAVVAAGGDGTVESVALRLIDRPTALGILPLGTAQNVARSLDVPLELDAAAAALARGHIRAVDVAEVRRAGASARPYLGIVSVGLGAEVLAQGDNLDEGRYGRFMSMLGHALRQDAVRLDVDLDGRTVRTRAIGLAVANGPYTGFGIELAPEARMDDGLLDVVLFEGFSRWGLLFHYLRRIGGRSAPNRGIRTYRAPTVRVRARHPLAVRADADDLGWTPVEVGLRPGALRVMGSETSSRKQQRKETR